MHVSDGEQAAPVDSMAVTVNVIEPWYDDDEDDDDHGNNISMVATVESIINIITCQS